MKWKFTAGCAALFAAVIAIGLGLKQYGTAPYQDPAPAGTPAPVQNAVSAAPRDGRPFAAISLPATVVSVHDGDTMRVRVTFEMPVRIRDCWAPELSEKGGIESRDNLRKICPVGTEVLVRIPFHDDVSHMLTMARVVGDVLFGGGQSVAKAQVESGNATVEKTK